MMRTSWTRRGTPVRHESSLTLPQFTAQWSELTLLGSDGEADATLSATTYLAPAPAQRPVIFLWNGGPGASSTPLHFEAFGPYLRRSGRLEPNPDTLLNDADLVFIDPVGTGFNRIVREEAGGRLLNTQADAEAVATFIREWLRVHERTDDAVHLIGESYGGYRLAAALEHLDEIDVHSLVLISPMLHPTASSEAPGNDLAAVFQLPVLAAAHAHHAGQDAVSAWDEATAFAEEPLLAQLFRAEGPASERSQKLAERIARFTGLPAELVLKERLRVPSEMFLRTRRADEKLLIGRLDTRVTGPLAQPTDPNRPPAADDPVLGLEGGNVILSPVVAAHLQKIADAPSDRDYIGLSLDLNFAWDWSPEFQFPGFNVDRSSNLGAFAIERPELQVLLIGGMFDLATPHTAATHALRHSGVPEHQWNSLLLRCGHSIDDAARPAAKAAIVALLNHSRGADS